MRVRQDRTGMGVRSDLLNPSNRDRNRVLTTEAAFSTRTVVPPSATGNGGQQERDASWDTCRTIGCNRAGEPETCPLDGRIPLQNRPQIVFFGYIVSLGVPV